MNTISLNSLPSIVTIDASIDILGHHDDNLKADYDSPHDSTTTAATSLDDYSDDYSADDLSESCVSESSESTYNSSSSYIIPLSGNCDPMDQDWKGEDEQDSDEDSVVMLRRGFRDTNHTSWSDKILEKMGEDVDSVIVPLKKDGGANANNDYYKNHINNKDSDGACYTKRVRRQGRRRPVLPISSDE